MKHDSLTWSAIAAGALLSLALAFPSAGPVGGSDVGGQPVRSGQRDCENRDQRSTGPEKETVVNNDAAYACAFAYRTRHMARAKQY